MERTGTGGPGRATRVLVLFSDIAEGHAATARALAAGIATARPETNVVLKNGLEHMGWFLGFLQRDLYKAQLAHMPWLYGFWYGVFDRSRLWRALGALAIFTLGCHGLHRLVGDQTPDVVVSTDPRVSIALGHLRMRGKIGMPVCATLTDLGGIKFWVHPGVDVHMVPHAGLLPEIERLAGQGSARLVQPPVHPAYYQTLSKAEARGLLALPQTASVILLSGGGWGAGDLRGALLATLALPKAYVVCICGHNESRRAELQDLASTLNRDTDRVRVLGFSGNMNELLAAADVLVHATGGVTCLEASVRRCPVIIYGTAHGHMRSVTRAMAEFEEAAIANSPAELTMLLAEVVAGKGTRGLDARAYPDAAGVILSARPRPGPWRQLRPWLTLRGEAPPLVTLTPALEEDLLLAKDA